MWSTCHIWMKEVITMRQQKRIASTFTGFVLIISFLSILRLFLVISNIKSAIDVNEKRVKENSKVVHAVFFIIKIHKSCGRKLTQVAA